MARIVRKVARQAPASGRMTLAAAAREAARRNERLYCPIVEGGLGQGPSERALIVASTIINGHVSVQQGLTPGWIYVPPDRAEEIIVEVGGVPHG